MLTKLMKFDQNQYPKEWFLKHDTPESMTTCDFTKNDTPEVIFCSIKGTPKMAHLLQAYMVVTPPPLGVYGSEPAGYLIQTYLNL